MINRAKLKAAADAAPTQWDSRIKYHVLSHLHKYVNPGRKRQNLTYNQLFNGVVEGMGIRQANLQKFLDKVTKMTRSERNDDGVRDAISKMVYNSENSANQRQKTKAA